MSDEFHFNDEDDAKAEIRAAVHYLLNGAAGNDRRDIVREIIEIVTRWRAACRLPAKIRWTTACPGARRGTEARSANLFG